MAGSKALGMYVRKRRGPRPIHVLADAVGKSSRWLSYVEAGRAAPTWDDLLAIANGLGPIDGKAFIDDAVGLLHHEADVEQVTSNVMKGVRRREFLGVLGAGAVGGIDLERIGRALHGLGLDSHVAEDMGALTRLCAAQSRKLAPSAVASVLQGHLRNYLDLVGKGPAAVDISLKAGAAEAALQAGSLSFRMGCPAEASHYWYLASGLASECGHDIVRAYVLTGRTLAHFPATRGGYGNGNPKAAQSLMDQALTVAGPKVKGVAAVTLHSWRAVESSQLGNETTVEQDLEMAARALSGANSPEEDLIGLGARDERELVADRALCYLQLGRPAEMIKALSPRELTDYPWSGWRSSRTCDLAGAYAQLGDYDHAADLLLQAADLAIASRDLWRIRRVQGVRERWMPSYTSEVTQELDRKLVGAVLT